MENRPFPIPTGEAFLVKTPYLDKVADRLYKEEQDEKVRQYKENQALDKEFATDLTKMRAVDIPDFQKKYGEFKQARISLLKKGNKATPEDYYAVLQKKADAFKLPTQSAEIKKQDEEILKDFRKNGKNYQPYTLNVLSERGKTPLSQFEKNFSDPLTGEQRTIDLNDVNDIIAYKGPTTDFTKAFKNAAGTFTKRGNPIEEDIDNGATKKITTIKGYNSPAQIATSLYDQVNTSAKSKRDFEEKFNYSDEEAASILDNYERLINSPEFKSAYPDAEEIPSKLFQTKLGRAIALSTMKYMVDNKPQTEIRNTPNFNARQDRKLKDQKEMEKDRDRKIRGRMEYKKSLGLDVTPEDEWGVAFTEIGGDGDVEATVIKTVMGIPYAKKGGIVRQGVVFGEDGSPMKEGEITLAKGDLPANMVNSLAKEKISLPSDYVKFKVKNGDVISVKTASKGWLSIEGMRNVQKNVDKEPQKAPRLEFGNKNKAQGNTNKKQTIAGF